VKIGTRNSSPILCWNLTKKKSWKHRTENIKYILWFEENWKHPWTLVLFWGLARTCMFRQGITLHPNNLFHQPLCQHWSSFCRMQLRPSNIVVLPSVLWLFKWFPYWIRLKVCKMWLYDLTWKIWLFMTL